MFFLIKKINFYFRKLKLNKKAQRKKEMNYLLFHCPEINILVCVQFFFNAYFIQTKMESLYSRELKTYAHTKDTCACMFTAALFLTAKKWKQFRYVHQLMSG